LGYDTASLWIGAGVTLAIATLFFGLRPGVRGSRTEISP
jgi:hypothetical protein